MNEAYFDVRSASPDFRDLRALIDDKRILHNPHKGWYMHYIDNGYANPRYRNTIEPGDHLESFPGMNHLYLRVDWVDIEKEEGCFDWSYLDQIFEEWSAYGYRFSFQPRFCPCCKPGHQNEPG